jgi:hypothetical protein
MDAWRLASRPALEIGVEDGPLEYVFDDIQGIVRLPDDRIAVADQGSSQLRVYSPTGVFLDSWGRSGRGPGEFQLIRGIGQCGADSVFVFDFDWRTVVLDSAIEYVREARPYDVADRARQPYDLVCNNQGYYAIIGWEDRAGGAPPQGLYRATAGAWLLSPIGSNAQTNPGSIPGAGLVRAADLGQFLSSERIGTAGGSQPHPFGRRTVMAIADGAAYLGTGEDYEVRRYTLAGDLTGVMRWHGADLAISDSLIETYRAEQRARAGDARRQAVEAALEEVQMPPSYPAYTRLAVDTRGNLWAQSFPLASSDSIITWHVLGTDGVLLGSVDIPRYFTPFVFGDREVLGVAIDELGVERVQIRQLSKPGRE